MKYRVVLKVGYHEAWFDFDSMVAAGDFATAVLIHQTGIDDTPAKAYVKILVMLEDEEGGDEE